MSLIANTLSNFRKVIHWGPRGVFNYLKGSKYRRHVRKLILDSCHGGNPKRGITLVGQFTQFGSPCKVVRDFAFSLRDADIPFQTLNIDPEKPSVPPQDVNPILTPFSEFAIDKYDHIIEILPSIVPHEITIPKARIAFWEFESGFLYGYPDMVNEKHVIAMSDFNKNYLRKELPRTVDITKILYPFRYENNGFTPKEQVRTRYNVGINDFVVFFNFDFGAGFNRKNPDGSMRAFSKAFSDIHNAKLVLKTKSANTHPDRVAQLRNLAKELGITSKLVMIDTTIPQLDLFGLTNACDVYLSLHRGEGFGITLAEAMAMGKPVVCTNWSATTEFCKPDCTLPVPYKLVQVKSDQIDHPYYHDVIEWAEADIDAAASVLRRLYEDHALRHDIGIKAAKSIKEQFSIANFKKSVEDFLA